MSEPMSKLRPPGDNGGVAEHVHEVRKSRLEWVVVDLDLRVANGGETFLPGLWRRMHEDGTFSMFFHEGPESNFYNFMSMLSTLGEMLQLIVGHDEQGNAVEHAGFTLLRNVLQHEKCRRALGNFCFFKEYWNRHDSRDLGMTVLRDWFETKQADTIAGTTPSANHAALRFIKRLGFRVIGEVPSFTLYQGEQCASVVSYMTKEMYGEIKGK